MNRLRAQVFSLILCLALLASAMLPGRALAQTPPNTNFWFAGTRLIFERAVPLEDEIAVSLHDPGLLRMLAKLGATVSYQPQQRYIAITSADRRVIAFTVGDAKYSVGGAVSKASFAPFIDGNEVIVPLFAIARSLYLEPFVQGGETVLEPQLGGLDIRPDGRRTILTLHGAVALRYTKLIETPERVQLAFSGIGSTLAQARRIGGGIDEVDVLVRGPAKDPTSTVTIEAPPGSQHLIATSRTPSDLTIVFGPPGVSLDVRQRSPDAVAQTSAAQTTERAGVAPPTPPPLATNTPSAAGPMAAPSAGFPAGAPEDAATAPGVLGTGPATVTNVAIDPVDDGLSVRLAISGNATYEWHRLLDDRWYIDVHNATLADVGRDEHPNSASVDSVRVRQIGTPDAPVVRVAFTLRGDRRVEIVPSESALTLAVTNVPETSVTRIGRGAIGNAALASAGAAAADAANANGLPLQHVPWKFGAVNGSRVIVIDPGHGGADAGTVHNGLTEKLLTFDMAQRLRALLTQAGWIVKMTRDTDIDPVSQANLNAFANDGKPNASDRAYLQTRCDVANVVNARMFISIHVNYAESTSPRGTTFYYTKPQDLALAEALEKNVIATAGTHDDGVVHNDFYVTKHTTMPAVLIETAFISNPGDAALLSNAAFLQRMAAGIAAGVRAYTGAQPAVTSKTDQ